MYYIVIQHILTLGLRLIGPFACISSAHEYGVKLHEKYNGKITCSVVEEEEAMPFES